MFKNLVHLYDKLWSTYLTKNKSMYGEKRDGLYIDWRGFYSGRNRVTYMYTIDGLPKTLDMSFRNRLRRECKEGIRMSFITTLERYTIQWSSPQMQSKLMAWKTLQSGTEAVDEYNLYDNLLMMDSHKWLRDSLRYLSSAEIRRRRKTFKVKSVMLLSGLRGDAFDSTIAEVTNLCASMNIRLTRVLYEIPEYLHALSPFSNFYSNKVLAGMGSNVLTDEIIARFSTYSQGTLGVHGTYFGTDIHSKFPVLKPVKITDHKAENWLMTAETEGGKSYYTKGVILSLLSSPRINGTIMDIEGFEYLALAYFMSKSSKVVIINMGEGTGKYFDSVEIVQTGNEDLDKDLYDMSKSCTLSIFKVLLGSALKTDVWLDTVVNDAVAKTYSEAGVSDEPETWSRSKGLTYMSVYNTLKNLKDYRTNLEYQSAVDKAVALISRYFDADGTRAKLFQHKISVNDIMEAKLVICSFGMAGKSSQSVDEVQMALMQLSAAHISHLRSIFSKLQGKFNFKLWEEFQRWGKFPDSEKTIGVALTGGRKLGDINIIITNFVAELLNDDRFGVFSNITSVAIGCIWDSKVRKDLVERLSIPQMLPELDRMVSEGKDLSDYSEGDNLSESLYKYAFLVGLDKTKYAIVKMRLPRKLGKSKLFNTGV